MNFRAVLVLPKTAGSVQTQKSMSFILIVLSALYVYLWSLPWKLDNPYYHSNDRQYYFLPYWDEKPTMWIRATFPDHRRRLYNSNVIGKPADKLVCSLLYCFALILLALYTNAHRWEMTVSCLVGVWHVPVKKSRS